MTSSLDFLAGGFGVLAFLANGMLALLIAAGRPRPANGLAGLYFIAAVTTALTGMVAALLGVAASRPVVLIEVVLWVILLAAVGHVLDDKLARLVAVLAVLLTIAIAIVAPADPWLMAMAATAIIGLFIVTALAGSFTSLPSFGGRVLFLALGIGFAFDVVLAALTLADAALQGTVEMLRPLLRALLVPFLLLGAAAPPLPTRTVALSPKARRLALVATSTAMALLVVAAAGAMLGRWIGPAVGLALFLPATLAILALALAPGAGRRMDALYSRCFSAHRYDYRAVWPGFVKVLTGADPRLSDDLPERVIRAVAGTVGAGGGAIWLAEGDDRYRWVAASGLASVGFRSGSAPGFGTTLLAAEAHNDVLEPKAGDWRSVRPAVAPPRGEEWPSFLPARETVWLVLPLVYKDVLFGFLTLGQPPSPRPLDHEDRELLTLVARQAASYLAEDEAARQLSNARQYENFTRRFAYVMHDVKNVAAELSLTLGNAKRHRGNQAFYDDMLETLEFSVQRMNRLIDQLRQERNPRLDRVPLAPLLRKVASRRADRRIVVDEPLTPVSARVEADALETAIEHLVDNALQAVGPGGRVRLGLEQRDRMAAVVVADDGPGMPPEILVSASRQRSFTSRKPGGLGLGLDQARNTVERVGGRFDLESSPAHGTTIALCLPHLEEVTI